VDYADIRKTDVVLEIGAGYGNLTKKIEEKAKKIYAIEIDEELCKLLEERCENTEVIHGDTLEVDFPGFDKIVASIPYFISRDVTFKLLRHDFELGIIMYQLDFARRMVAAPGSLDYSGLSVGTQYFSDVSVLEVVPRTAFHPKPRVESAIVKIVPFKGFEVESDEFFLRFVKAVFTQRRKKMRNAILKTTHIHLLNININDLEKKLRSLPGELMEKRAEELSPAEISYISEYLNR
jgi:16S rRNA (adenine1518-N6/adenine1519-N6)-dimethyltransferase